MRPLHIACALSLLLVVAATAPAAEPQTTLDRSGEVPTAQLAELGLGGMQTLSDAEGEQIRGQGPLTARVFTSGVLRPQLMAAPQLRRDPLVREFSAGLITAIFHNPFTW